MRAGVSVLAVVYMLEGWPSILTPTGVVHGMYLQH